jgi:hypothetical protein
MYYTTNESDYQYRFCKYFLFFVNIEKCPLILPFILVKEKALFRAFILIKAISNVLEVFTTLIFLNMPYTILCSIFINL